MSYFLFCVPYPVSLKHIFHSYSHSTYLHPTSHILYFHILYPIIRFPHALFLPSMPIPGVFFSVFQILHSTFPYIPNQTNKFPKSMLAITNFKYGKCRPLTRFVGNSLGKIPFCGKRISSRGLVNFVRGKGISFCGTMNFVLWKVSIICGFCVKFIRNELHFMW